MVQKKTSSGKFPKGQMLASEKNESQPDRNLVAEMEKMIHPPVKLSKE